MYPVNVNASFDLRSTCVSFGRPLALAYVGKSTQVFQRLTTDPAQVESTH